jgi:hypothetical protein
MFHDIAWKRFSTMISTLYRVQHTYINFFHDDFHAICVQHTYINLFTLYRGKNTHIIKGNPFHDDATADEKYQFTYSVVERINFSDRNSVKCEKHVVPSVITNNDIY